MPQRHDAAGRFAPAPPADRAAELELERLRPTPPLPAPSAWLDLFDLIAGECRRAGMLPARWRPPHERRDGRPLRA